MKPPVEYTVRDVATFLEESMTDHDVGWANWKETVHMNGVSVVYFTVMGYNTTDKLFTITIEEA